MNKIAKLFILFFVFGLMMSSAQALTILNQPISFTAYDNGSIFYSPNSYAYSGAIVAYGNLAPGTQIQTFFTEKGIDTHTPSSITYTDSDPTVGTLTIADLCASPTSIYEMFDASKVFFTVINGAPASITTPSFFAAAQIPCAANEQCVNTPLGAKCSIPQLPSFPLNTTMGNAGTPLKIANVTGTGIPSIITSVDPTPFAPTGGPIIVNASTGQIQNLNIISGACTGFCTDYGLLAIGDIDSTNPNPMTPEIIAQNGTGPFSNMHSYTSTSTSFTVTPGFPFPITPGIASPANQAQPPVIADTDGDGKNDIIKELAYRTTIAGVDTAVVEVRTFSETSPSAWTLRPPFPIALTTPIPSTAYPNVIAFATKLSVISKPTNPVQKDIVVARKGIASPPNSNYIAFPPELRIIDGITGVTLPGWPYKLSNGNPNTQYYITAPVITDIIGNSNSEIIVATTNNSAPIGNVLVYAFDYAGNLIPNFPVSVPVPAFPLGAFDGPSLQLSVADLDGDGKKDILVGSIGIVKGDGSILNKYINSSIPISPSSFVADLDGDHYPDILFVAPLGWGIFPNLNSTQAIYAKNAGGNLLPGFPITVLRDNTNLNSEGSISNITIKLGDPIGNGITTLMYKNYGYPGTPGFPNGLINAFPTAGNASDIKWGELYGNSQNTGEA